MTWLLLSGDLVDAGKAPHGFLPLREKRVRVRLSLEQDLNAANDREGHCTTESLRDARGLRPVRVRMGRNLGLSLDGLLVSFLCSSRWLDGLMSLAGTPCYWIPSVACPGSTSAWRASSFSLRRDPCCGPGWASVPVIRSGNTGKSRFLGASL